MSNQLFSSLSTFNPETEDTSYINSISAKIPKDGHIDLAIAEQLATNFLHGADYAADLVCKCSAYAGMCEAERREIKARAIDARINGNGVTKVAASVAVQLFGDDAAYKAVHQKQAIAEAFLEWLRTKHKSLMAAHVLCKDIVKLYETSRKQGNQAGRDPHDLDEDRVTSSDENCTKVSGGETW